MSPAAGDRAYRYIPASLRPATGKKPGAEREPPLELIVCAGKSHEHVELLRLSETGIRVAAYLWELAPRELLARKPHDAVRAARARLEGRGASVFVPNPTTREAGRQKIGG